MRLYDRAVGTGPPIVVLHGGPDFDHTYLLPGLDRLAESFRLIYYDQRGRGRSDPDVDPNDVDIASEVADLDSVRARYGLDAVAVLGHSFGGLLAMEYAARHPDRVTHLILLNTAPASADDWAALRQHFAHVRPARDVERLQEISSSTAYRAGDLDAEAEYHRVHFSLAVRDPDHLEELVPRLREHFTAQGVLRARAIEERLYDETWKRDGYDLLGQLRTLEIPTLVLHGEHDFIPVELAAHIAEAMPRGRLVVLPDCGHFSYVERPDAVHEQVVALFEETGGLGRRGQG